MPCNSDYLNPTDLEKNLSIVYALLDEVKTGKLPETYSTGYHENVYSKGLSKHHLDEKVQELCSILKESDPLIYSLEMQIWWRDHQFADSQINNH